MEETEQYNSTPETVHANAVDELVEKYAQQYEQWNHHGKWQKMLDDRRKFEDAVLDAPRKAILTAGAALLTAAYVEQITGTHPVPNLLAVINVLDVPKINSFGETLFHNPNLKVAITGLTARLPDSNTAESQNEQTIGSYHLAKAYAKDYAGKIKSKLELLKK